MIISVVKQIGELDCLIVLLFEDKEPEKVITALDVRYKGSMQRARKAGDIEGKKLQSLILYTDDPTLPRLLLMGLGIQEESTMTRLKKVIAAGVRIAQEKKYRRIGLLLPTSLVKTYGARILGREATVAAFLGGYAFDEYKEESARVVPIKEFILISDADTRMMQEMKKGTKDGEIVGGAVNYTRHLGNIPPSHMTPTRLGKEAEKLGKEHATISVKVLGRTQIEKLGMGCLLGVAQGSDQEPKFIILEYHGAKEKQPIVLTGKGITFDSGGLSLKPMEFLNNMKFDMLGAAMVFGVLKAAAMLKIRRRIIGLIPSCENMPSGRAYRPDDILRAMNGVTVEVQNTDAEGRLILADAICYAAQYKPKILINLATLTGHCLIALGNERSGLFSQDETLTRQLCHAGEEVGEQLWRLPLGEEFTENIKSDVADIKNTGGVGNSRYGGASIGAAFLEYFTAFPFAHIDLSCSYYLGTGKPWIRHGANGFGVQTLIAFLRDP